MSGVTIFVKANSDADLRGLCIECGAPSEAHPELDLCWTLSIGAAPRESLLFIPRLYAFLGGLLGFAFGIAVAVAVNSLAGQGKEWWVVGRGGERIYPIFVWILGFCIILGALIGHRQGKKRVRMETNDSVSCWCKVWFSHCAHCQDVRDLSSPLMQEPSTISSVIGMMLFLLLFVVIPLSLALLLWKDDRLIALCVMAVGLAFALVLVVAFFKKGAKLVRTGRTMPICIRKVSRQGVKLIVQNRLVAEKAL